MVKATLIYSDADGPHAVALDAASNSIGRSPSRNIQLRDPYTSRQHAIILHEGDSWTLVDQNSAHGTFANSKRVERKVLEPGDQLQFGSLNGPRLTFQLEPAAQRPAPSRIEETPTQGFLASLGAGFTLKGDEPASAARSMEQLNWLLGAARRLNEGAAIADVLDALLQLTLQLTGLERGFVFIQSPAGSPVQSGENASGMHFERGLTSAGAVLHEDSTVSRRAIAQALASHSRFSISDTLVDDRAAEWSSMVAKGIRSIFCIPLRKPGPPAAQAASLLGLLYLDSQIGPGHLTDIDHRLLETIATEAAALLHNALLAEAEFNARREREELAVAARIHRGLMASDLPVLPYARLQARSVPCDSIGGDFYDAIALDDALGVTIADVSGKGVPAAIVAATLQGIIHAQMLAGQPLEQIAALVNRFLCTRKVGKYATLIMLKLYPDGRLDYINCGHLKPLAVHGGRVRRLQAANLIVGLIQGAAYTAARDALVPGERLLLVTDGLTEAENQAGESFGDSGLDAIHHLVDVEAILKHVAGFQARTPSQDDCTLLQIVYDPAPASRIRKPFL